MNINKLSIWVKPYTYRSKLVYFLISIIPLAVLTYFAEIYVFPILSTQHQRYLIYSLTSIIYCLLFLSILGYTILHRDAVNTLKIFEEHNNQITKLFNISQSLSSTIDLDVLLSQILNDAVELLKAEASSLFLYEKECDYLVFKATSGPVTNNLHIKKAKLGQGIAGWVAMYQKPTIVNNVELESRYDPYVDCIAGFYTKSILCVPMIFKEQLLGVLEIVNKIDTSSFNVKDLEILQSLASQATIALKNASYYETLKKHYERLQAEVDKRTSELKKINEQLQQEIKEHKESDKEVKASLKEKEILLQEIHHRVKNNLQIICSLLNLQSKHVREKEVQHMFQDSKLRVRSMALIHEKIYQSENLARIDLSRYIKSFVDELISSYKTRTKDIKTNINVESIFLDLDLAIPCGLIINELVSNSLKYAFPSGNDGEINIDIHKQNDNKIKLIVGDNGIGISKEYDIQNPTSLGLQLVNTLVKQLKGNIKLGRNNGTVFKIIFSGNK